MISERSSRSPLTPTSMAAPSDIPSNTTTSSTNGDRATTMGVSPIRSWTTSWASRMNIGYARDDSRRSRPPRPGPRSPLPSATSACWHALSPATSPPGITAGSTSGNRKSRGFPLVGQRLRIDLEMPRDRNRTTREPGRPRSEDSPEKTPTNPHPSTTSGPREPERDHEDDAESCSDFETGIGLVHQTASRLLRPQSPAGVSVSTSVNTGARPTAKPRLGSHRTTVQHHDAEDQRQIRQTGDRRRSGPAASLGDRQNRAHRSVNQMPKRTHAAAEIQPATPNSVAVSPDRDQQRRRRGHDLPGDATARIEDREHRMTTAPVVLPVHPGQREEVRKLPDEQQTTQHPRARLEPTRGGAPTDHRRDGATDRPEQRVRGGDRFERGVDRRVDHHVGDRQHARRSGRPIRSGSRTLPYPSASADQTA